MNLYSPVGKLYDQSENKQQYRPQQKKQTRWQIQAGACRRGKTVVNIISQTPVNQMLVRWAVNVCSPEAHFFKSFSLFICYGGVKCDLQLQKKTTEWTLNHSFLVMNEYPYCKLNWAENVLIHCILYVCLLPCKSLQDMNRQSAPTIKVDLEQIREH